jgi:hypothetical protein
VVARELQVRLDAREAPRVALCPEQREVLRDDAASSAPRRWR